MSLRTSVTGMINLDDVRVPRENMLDVIGMRGPFDCLNNARLGISFGVLGASQYCIETVLTIVKPKTFWSIASTEKQLIQMKIARYGN